MKHCSACETAKPLSEFKTDKRRSHGVASICRICSASSCAAYRKNHPDTRVVRKRGKRRVHRTEKTRAYQRKYQKAWEHAHPEKMRVLWRNKRAKRQSAPGNHTTSDVAAILAAQRGRCAYCRKRLNKRHVDHIVPLARNGHNGRRNLQILCPTCNVRKSHKDPLTFARELGRLL